MIKKLLSVLVLVFALSGSVLAQQSMSDQQVLEYVKTGMQQGKDQRQIATELARRGVTQEQAKRVKKLYEQQNGSADKDANATMQNRNRLREKTKTQEDIYVTENFTFDQRPVAGGVVGKNLSDSVSANRYYDVVGGLCENNDKFAIDRMLPKIDIGDIVYIHDTGAHGSAMGYNYNGKLRSAEVLLCEDGTHRLIRRAETPRDYFATLDFLPLMKPLFED